MITRPVWKLDKKTGKPIMFYACVADYAREIERSDAQCVYDCCRGKLKSWNGYKWRYATQKEVEEHNQNNELCHSRRQPKGT